VLPDAAHNGANTGLEHVVAAAFVTATRVWMELLKIYNNVLRASAGVIIFVRGKTFMHKI
jgi:hypothetical protein